MPKLDKIQTDIDALAKDWDISGRFAVMYKGELLMDSVYGYSDRAAKKPLTKNDTFCISLYASFILGMVSLKLCGKGLMSLDSTVDKYIPEYVHASKMTVRDLLFDCSGIADYFPVCVATKLEHDEAHMALSVEERFVRENKLVSQGFDFADVISALNELPLEHEPDLEQVDYSDTPKLFLAEIIRRVSGKSLYDCANEYLFAPCGMTHVTEGYKATTASYGIVKSVIHVRLDAVPCKDVFTTTFEDMALFVQAITDKKILTKEEWREALKQNKLDEEQGTICFSYLNGVLSAYIVGPLGSTLGINFNQKTRMCYFSILNEYPESRNLPETGWTSFRPLTRSVLEGAFQEFTKPRFVRVNKQNLWRVISLRVSTEQEAFVSNAKESICYAYVDKSNRAYALMDEGRVVGLLILGINKKIDHYGIEIVQIDKRFQGRGYGKFMLRWAVDELKKHGAKKLEIGVNRNNPVARHLYESVGFVATQVYDEGVHLEMNLEG